MQWLIEYAFALCSRTHRYQFGGQNPILGFDCSGFVQEILMAAGEIPWDSHKLDSQELYNHYEPIASSAWGAGALSFYGRDCLHIDHVGFCIDQKVMLESAGGDEKCVNDEIAIRENAFVKLRPIRYRRDFLLVLKPRYALLGMS